MTPEAFDRARLSAREDEILEAAIEGMTDIQIAKRMAISQSTVNSYWVRIRGKLGQSSRTELVAHALKAQARTEMDAVTAELASLQEVARQNARTGAIAGSDDLCTAALEAMPEALIVIDESRAIRYVNRRAEAMFRFGEGTMTGLAFETLFSESVRVETLGRLVEHLASAEPFRLGLDRVVYGRHRDGTLFRIVLFVDTCATARGRIYSMIVRDFASEVDTRRAYTSTWN